MPRIGNPRAAYSYREDDEEHGGDEDIVVQLDDYRRESLPDTFDEDGNAVKAKAKDAADSEGFDANLAETFEERFYGDEPNTGRRPLKRPKPR